MESSILNIIGALPHGHEKPLKQAIYNALALLLLFIVCAAVWALYVILGPFVKPLMWAVLVGSVLYPIKYNMSHKLHTWIDQLAISNTPAIIGMFIIPINVLNDLSEFIGSNLLKRIKVIIGLAVMLPILHVLYYYTPKIMLCLAWKVGLYTNYILSWLINYSSATLISIFIVGYLSLLYVTWTPRNNNLFHTASLVIWMLISCYVSHLFSTFQVGIFILLQLVSLLGLYTEVYSIFEECKSNAEHKTLFQCFVLAIQNRKCSGLSTTNTSAQKEICEKTADSLQYDEGSMDANVSKGSDNVMDGNDDFKKKVEIFEHCSMRKANEDKDTPRISDSNESQLFTSTPQDSNICQLVDANTKPIYLSAPIKAKCSSQFILSRQSTFVKRKVKPMTLSNRMAVPQKSDYYIYLLFWACGIMVLWKHLTFLPILFIPILVYVLKHVGIFLGVWNVLLDYMKIGTCRANRWCEERSDALVPVHIRGLYKCLLKVNGIFRVQLHESIDVMSSCVVILGVIIFVSCSSVYIAFQVYSETILLVEKTGHVINETIISNPELRKYLPPSIDESLDQFLDNAYVYGRDGVKKAVRGMMSDVDSPKSEKFEKQVLELFDRIYQSWMQSHHNGPKVSSNAVEKSWNAFLNDVTTTPEIFNFSYLYQFIKQNIGTFASITESLWGLFVGNISLIIGSFSAFISILLGGGTVVLNFILNTVVFFTTLFYLLSSSGNMYKPVEIVSNMAPYSGGHHFGKAFEGAVNGVFKASFKMALFYGLWTWLIHNLFGVQIVYIPSAFAAILGAVPFLGTYWACIPAVLDLWLAQNCFYEAVLLAIIQVLPMAFVDSAIYDEIEGGSHPYLTGLAVAGGIFCLGVEGAIIGPLLLCGLYVAIDLSSYLFLSPSEESVQLPGQGSPAR